MDLNLSDDFKEKVLSLIENNFSIEEIYCDDVLNNLKYVKEIL